MARKEADEKRLDLAAHVYIFTTKDGMIISYLTHISPLRLYQWSLSEAWTDALKFWKYEGDSSIEGKEFHRQVGLSLTKRSLQEAFRLWKELFGVSESKERLNRFFGSEVPSIEETVGASNLNPELRG